MGLDMYLSKKTDVKNWNFRDENYEVTAKKNGQPIDHIKPDRVQSIEEEVMYWRKANQIHGWFVENIQDGVDNCGTYYVSRDKLIELMEICKDVIDARDEQTSQDLLPVSSGFFFGSNHYDQWYYYKVKDTYEFLKEELSEDYGYDVSYYYQSSW